MPRSRHPTLEHVLNHLRSLGPLTARLILAASLLAGSAEAAAGFTVREIRVSGNTRTATGHVLQLLRIHPGDRFEGDPAILEQRLLNARIFKAVHVTVMPAAGGDARLEIAVQERWTLIPLPVFSSSSGDTSGGLFLMEGNLAGWGKSLSAGGMYGDRKQLVFGSYRDPSIAGSPFTAGGLVTWQEGRIAQRDDDDAVVRAYREERLAIGVDAGVRLGRMVTLGLGGFGLQVHSRPEPGHVAPASVSDAWGGMVAADFRDEDYHLYYVSGASAHAEYRRALPELFGGRELEAGSLLASWAGGNGLGHAWALSTRGFWLLAGDPVIDAGRLGGRNGSRGLAADALWAERSATATLEYQIPLWRPRWGVLTAAAFTDAGMARWRGEVTRYVAPGLGARLYLSGIAIPAVGLDVAEASTVREPKLSFSVGFQL